MKMKIVIASVLMFFSVQVSAQVNPTIQEASKTVHNAKEIASKQIDKKVPIDNFRGHSWGSSFEAVIRKEGIDYRIIDEDENKGTKSILYVESILNRKTNVVFKFIDNKLFTGFLSFEVDDLNANESFLKFIELYQIIESKYGSNDFEECEGYCENINDLIKSNIDLVSSSIRNKLTKLTFFWKHEDCAILLRAGYENNLTILYTNQSLQKIKENKEKAKF